MNDAAEQNIQSYAAARGLKLKERLGFGIHGSVYRAASQVNPGRSAVKGHLYNDPYHREVAAYERLREAGVSQILGHNVPRLLGHDNGLRIIEMSVVARPFVLDFGGAWLDVPPAFSDEIWDEWETRMRTQFGERWTSVQEILGALEELGIHMIDVSPSNIALGG